MNFIKKIIELYKLNYSKEPDSWIEFSKSQKNLTNAIKVSCLNLDHEGKLHPHQYRLNKISTEKFYSQCLSNLSSFKKIKTFHELMELLDRLKVTGIGELAVYDTATRIGAYLNIFPDRVYLHRGTREGAKKLLGSITKPYLLKSDLPKEFQSKNITYSEIEDILCIYKDNFTEVDSVEDFKKSCLTKIRKHC